MAKKLLSLENDEYEHLLITLEGCREELLELEKEVEWYSTLLVDRIEDCLEILKCHS